MQKKRGRKKKRGPKKKKPQVIHTYVGLKRPYHIITSNNGMQIKDVYSAVTAEVAIAKMKEMQANLNKDIQFPVRFTSTRNTKTFTKADYRLLLIKKRSPDDIYNGKIRNELGKLVDCITSSEEWMFIEDLPYQVEETFWVYGYNPKCDRKTYKFIVENFMTYDKNDRYFFKQVVVYRNKLLIDSVEKMDMVICKNHQDSVRLYNMLHEYCKKNKYRNIVFGGDIKQNSYSYPKWFGKIKLLTNWTRRKINKNTTRD